MTEIKLGKTYIKPCIPKEHFTDIYNAFVN